MKMGEIDGPTQLTKSVPEIKSAPALDYDNTYFMAA